MFATGGAFAALKDDGSVVTWGQPGQGGDSELVKTQLSDDIVAVTSPIRQYSVETDLRKNREWIYTPNENYNGPDSFTVTITDDLGAKTNQAIALNIASVDDTGTISGETNTTGEEDTILRGRLIASDLDGLTDGEYFSIESVDQTSNGAASIDPYSGDWSYHPNQHFYGTDSFTVTVTDDLGGTTSQTVELEVLAVDDQSIVNGDTEVNGEEDKRLTGTLSASDIEGLEDGSYFSIDRNASNGTASIESSSGDWHYEPKPNFYGTDSFSVTITDDVGGTTRQTVELEILPVDDLAVISGDISKTGEEEERITGIINAEDIDGETIFTIAETNDKLPIEIYVGSGRLTRPYYNFYKDHSGTELIEEVTLNTNQIYKFSRVNNESDHPFYLRTREHTNSSSDFIINGDGTDGRGITGSESFTLQFSDDADLESLNLYYYCTSHPSMVDNFTLVNAEVGESNGTSKINTLTGEWSYTPNKDFYGNDSFNVTVIDEFGGTTTQQISLSILNVDDKSIVTGDTEKTGEDVLSQALSLQPISKAWEMAALLDSQKCIQRFCIDQSIRCLEL